MANQTILHFHTGRGGHFHNPGFVSFCGQKTIQEILNIEDSRVFINYENEMEIFKLLESRNLTNLISLFEKCLDKQDFTEFENKTGLELGEQWYVDHNGSQLISVEQAETGIGSIAFDGSYDSDTCMLLENCDESELMKILESDQYGKLDYIKEYFDDFTELKFDWEKVEDDKFTYIISDYFNHSKMDVEDYYREEEA